MPTSTARSRWAPIVDDLEASGQTARTFASARGLNASTLAWWRWRLRREADRRAPRRPAFSELTLVEEASPRPVASGREGEHGLVLTLNAYGAEVRVDTDTDLALLRDVLEALC